MLFRTARHLCRSVPRLGPAAGLRLVRPIHQTRASQSLPGFDANNPTLHKLQGNPRVMKAMADAMQLLQSKGLIDAANPKPPSMMKMMQMMADTDVKQKFLELQQIMKEEGISFSPADVAAFMNVGGMAAGQGDVQEKPPPSAADRQGLLGRISSSFRSKS
ncbi:hypothetical protein LPJ63_004943 [Coemansia sp. RSA 2711]|nr:hypothetical protein LPJ63_004943 [Coemansia sp. RSA 2711]KAJ2727805.1 hypothetical protein H4R23_003771 [Coemansia sp. Cherry 401B]